MSALNPHVSVHLNPLTLLNRKQVFKFSCWSPQTHTALFLSLFIKLIFKQ